MPSVAGTLWYYLVKLAFYRKRHSTEKERVDGIFDGYLLQTGPQKVPPAAKAASVQVKENVFRHPSCSEEWQNFEFIPEALDTTKKVVIYFHGGGFVLAVSVSEGDVQALMSQAHPLEWKVPMRIAREHRLPVFFPHWGLAPLSTALTFAETAVEYVLSVAADPRFAGREIVLVGSSAGGWCALRSLLALCEAHGAGQLRVQDALARIHQIILVAPVVSPVMDERAEEVATRDPFLGVEHVTLMGNLWAYGPAAFPTLLDRLPEGDQVRARQWYAESKHRPLTDPAFSPAFGLHVLRDYLHSQPRSKPFRFLSVIGTSDVLYPGVEGMHQELRGFGDTVKETLFLAHGMFHPYLAFPMPETTASWKLIGDALDG